MTSTSKEFPISLRSWSSATNEDDPKQLPDTIRRINIERGGFLNITEATLRQEIVEAELSQSAEDHESSDEDEDEEPDRAKELLAARDELLKEIEQAHQAAMLATEMVSAALTKQIPVQASASMSPELRSFIGIGTIGMEKLHAPRITSTIREDSKKTAKGWKIQALNTSVDSILAAAERLKTEVEHETIFWGQVLAISENKWAICKLPYDRHTLGVRFGFSEASPRFRDRSLAALKRNDDGTITLDQGLASIEPQIVRVRIRTGQRETGASRVPQSEAENAPIESLILQARNTIFAQELWHELNRESRGLGSYNVRAKDNTLTFPLTSNKTIVLDLVTLGDVSSQATGGDDSWAEGIAIAFNLLLALAHRHNHRKLAQPPSEVIIDKQNSSVYNIIRPFLNRIKHQETLSHIHTLLRPLSRALRSALPNDSSKYIMNLKPSERVSKLPKAEQVLVRMTNNLEASTLFTITKDIYMVIKMRTVIEFVASQYTVETSPLLSEICPPPPHELPFNTLSALNSYVYFATSCGLAEMLRRRNEKNDEGDGDGDGTKKEGEREGKRLWMGTAVPNMLKVTYEPSQRSKQFGILVRQLEQTEGRGGVKVQASWGWTTTNNNTLGEQEPVVDAGMNKESGVGNGIGRGKWKGGQGWYEWVVREDDDGDIEMGEDDGKGGKTMSLEEVLEEAGK